MPKSPKSQELLDQIEVLTHDLQRSRADFENYRKRIETEKEQARTSGTVSTITKLLPVIDTIERAITHAPDELKENAWVQAVTGLTKQLDKSLDSLHVARISSEIGSDFNPELHEAIQFDDEAEGTKEVIAEILQSGYTYAGTPIRHAMVKVTKK